MVAFMTCPTLIKTNKHTYIHRLGTIAFRTRIFVCPICLYMKSDLKSNLRELLNIFLICFASYIPLKWSFEISLWSYGNSESSLKTLPKAGVGRSEIILCQSYDEMKQVLTLMAAFLSWGWLKFCWEGGSCESDDRS